MPPPDLWIRAVYLTASKMLLHGVLHRQHEAGGELPKLAAGVHQGRGVGHKGQARHHLVEFPGGSGHVRGGVVVLVHGSDGVGHPPEHVRRGFGHLALGVLLEVAAFQDD